MSTRSITDALRAKINESDLPIRELGRATGISHVSLIKFRRGEFGLLLSAADRLAEYFGLELKPAQPAKNSRRKTK